MPTGPDDASNSSDKPQSSEEMVAEILADQGVLPDVIGVEHLVHPT